MRFFITCDSFWQSEVEKVIDKIDNTGYKKFFFEKNYGDSLNGITVVLMCQDPNLNLKQRVRMSKTEKKIYLDIMLDLSQFLKISYNEKQKIIIEKLITQVPATIAKYKLEKFDFLSFKKDLEMCMTKIS